MFIRPKRDHWSLSHINLSSAYNLPLISKPTYRPRFSIKYLLVYCYEYVDAEHPSQFHQLNARGPNLNTLVLLVVRKLCTYPILFGTMWHTDTYCDYQFHHQFCGVLFSTYAVLKPFLPDLHGAVPVIHTHSFFISYTVTVSCSLWE